MSLGSPMCPNSRKCYNCGSRNLNVWRYGPFPIAFAITCLDCGTYVYDDGYNTPKVKYGPKGVIKDES